MLKISPILCSLKHYGGWEWRFVEMPGMSPSYIEKSLNLLNEPNVMAPIWYGHGTHCTLGNFSEMCPKIQIILLINFVKIDKINEQYLNYSSFMKKRSLLCKYWKKCVCKLGLKTVIFSIFTSFSGKKLYFSQQNLKFAEIRS